MLAGSSSHLGAGRVPIRRAARRGFSPDRHMRGMGPRHSILDACKRSLRSTQTSRVDRDTGRELFGGEGLPSKPNRQWTAWQGIPVLCARELGGSRPSAGTVSYCSLHANGKPKSEQKAPLPGDKPPIDTTTTLPANLSALPQLPPAIPVGPAAARALAVEGGAELDRRFSEWLAKRYARPPTRSA